MRIPYGESSVAGRQYISLWREIVAVILRAIDEGWEFANLRPDVHQNALEVPITECLRDGMREALKQRKLKSLIVLPGTESRSKPSILLPDGRTDIPILVCKVFFRTQEHDPHAIVECKRISGSDNNLAREYVVSGIDRFCNEQYSSNHKIGFMVGYVISGVASTAVDAVNRYLKKQSRDKECLGKSFEFSSNKHWQSHHPRSGHNEKIRLYHSMLELCVNKIN